MRGDKVLTMARDVILVIRALFVIARGRWRSKTCHFFRLNPTLRVHFFDGRGVPYFDDCEAGV